MNKQEEGYDSSRPKWTIVETKTLIELSKLGWSFKKVSQILDKPENFVKARFYELVEEGLVEPIKERLVEPIPEKSRSIWTEDQTTSLISLRKHGCGLRRISKILNMSENDVRAEVYRCTKEGLIEEPASKSGWTVDETETFVELISQDISLRDIEKKFGKTRQAIQKKITACAKEGLLTAENCSHIWSEDQIQLLLELRTQGVTFREIGEKIGKSRQVAANKYDYYLKKGLVERILVHYVWLDSQTEILTKLRTKGVKYPVIAEIVGRKESACTNKFHSCVKKGLAEHPDYNVIPWTEDETTTLLESMEQGVELDTILEQLGRL